MAEFYESSIWMKLSMMLVSGAFSMHLFSMDAPGWSTYQESMCTGGLGGCFGNLNAVRAVQAMEVIGFLSVLTALFLSLCLVLLDELKGNRLALICLCAFSLLAGSFIIVIIVGILCIGVVKFEQTSLFRPSLALFQVQEGILLKCIRWHAWVLAITPNL